MKKLSRRRVGYLAVNMVRLALDRSNSSSNSSTTDNIIE